MKTFAVAGGFAGPVSLPGMRIPAAAFLITALGAIAGNAAAETVAEIASPNGALTVTVTLDPDGRPGYAISPARRRRHRRIAARFHPRGCPEARARLPPRGRGATKRGRNLGAALGRAAVRARPLQRASRPPRREARRRAAPGRRLPRLRRRHRLPLRISGTGGAHGRRDRRRADRIRGRGAGDGLVDSRRRLEPLRIPLPEDAARGSRPGPHADDDPDRRAGCMSPSTRQRSSTTRRCGCGGAAQASA